MSKKAPQLHEALAVRQTLNQQATTVVNNEIQNFKSKQHIFEGHVTTFKPLEEGAKDVIEDAAPMSAVVKENLEYGVKAFAKALECEYQIERGNQNARADVICDGVTVFKDAPATFLLVISKRLKEIRNLYDAIPTMDMKKGFEVDNRAGKAGVYVSNPDVRKRTKKDEQHIVVVQPTKEHPAQVAKVVKDIETGVLETIHYAGKLTPHDKAALIGRIDRLIRAVDRARSAANRVEIDTTPVTKTLVNFLLEVPSVSADKELEGELVSA